MRYPDRGAGDAGVVQSGSLSGPEIGLRRANRAASAHHSDRQLYGDDGASAKADEDGAHDCAVVTDTRSISDHAGSIVQHARCDFPICDTCGVTVAHT
jgi:hypothetical protein